MADEGVSDTINRWSDRGNLDWLEKKLKEMDIHGYLNYPFYNTTESSSPVLKLSVNSRGG